MGERVDKAGQHKTCCLSGCDKPLKKWPGKSRFWRYADHIQPYGWAGNGYFCSMACAAEFGVFKSSSMSEEP